MDIAAFHAQAYRVIRMIPPGKVTSYGKLDALTAPRTLLSPSINSTPQNKTNKQYAVLLFRWMTQSLLLLYVLLADHHSDAHRSSSGLSLHLTLQATSQNSSECPATRAMLATVSILFHSIALA